MSLTLKELAEKQSNGLPAYFKGGTALYKALKTTIDYDKAMEALTDIYKNLLKNTSWVKYQFYKTW